MTGTDTDQLMASFMVAEHEGLINRVLQLERTRSNRVNFYLAIVTAVTGAVVLGLQSQALERMHHVVVPTVLLILLTIGLATLAHYVDLAAQAVFLYRRAGRVRCWFHDKDPTVLPYLAWTPGDDTPPFRDVPGYATFAARDPILMMGNATIAAASALFIRSGATYWPVPWILVCVVVWAVTWWAQGRYIKYMVEKYERIGAEGGRIHFPRTERTWSPPSRKR